jgi:hypothetical protein
MLTLAVRKTSELRVQGTLLEMHRSVARTFVESDGSRVARLWDARHLPCVSRLGSRRNFASPRTWFEQPSVETVVHATAKCTA